MIVWPHKELNDLRTNTRQNETDDDEKPSGRTEERAAAGFPWMNEADLG